MIINSSLQKPKHEKLLEINKTIFINRNIMNPVDVNSINNFLETILNNLSLIKTQNKNIIEDVNLQFNLNDFHSINLHEFLNKHFNSDAQLINIELFLFIAIKYQTQLCEIISTNNFIPNRSLYEELINEKLNNEFFKEIFGNEILWCYRNKILQMDFKRKFTNLQEEKEKFYKVFDNFNNGINLPFINHVVDNFFNSERIFDNFESLQNVYKNQLFFIHFSSL